MINAQSDVFFLQTCESSYSTGPKKIARMQPSNAAFCTFAYEPEGACADSLLDFRLLESEAPLVVPASKADCMIAWKHRVCRLRASSVKQHHSVLWMHTSS